MRNFKSLSFFLLFLIMVGCSNTTTDIENHNNESNDTSESKEVNVFTDEDIEKAQKIIQTVNGIYESHNEEFLLSKKDSVNENISTEILEQLNSHFYYKRVNSVIGNYQRDIEINKQQHFVTIPDDCYFNMNNDSSIPSIKSDCQGTIEFDSSMFTLKEHSTTFLENLDVNIMVIPFEYKDKQLINDEYVFGKTKDNNLIVFKGLEFNSVNIVDLDEKAKEELSKSSSSQSFDYVKEMNLQ